MRLDSLSVHNADRSYVAPTFSRSRRWLGAIVGSGILVASFACGGGSTPPAENPSAANPSGAASGGTSEGDASAASALGTPAMDAGSASTTTMTLGDGGDIQGMKLTTTSSTTTVTKDAGAKSGPALDGKPDPGRSKTDLQTLVMSHRDEARACYDRELKKNAQISEGDLVIHWVIDPKGNPTEVAADTSRSQITEPAVVNCVIDVIKKIKFSESPRGLQTTTNYPFNFKRGTLKK